MNKKFFQNNIFRIIRFFGMIACIIANIVLIVTYFSTLKGFCSTTVVAFISANALTLLAVGFYGYGIYRDRKKEYIAGARDDKGFKTFMTVFLILVFAMLLGLIDTIVMLFFAAV